MSILIYSNILNAEMRTSDLLKATILAALINVLLNMILLPLFKSISVPAITTFIAYALSWLLVYNKIKDKWRLDLGNDFIFKLLIISFSVGITSKFSYSLIYNDFSTIKISLLVSILTSCFIFILLAFIFKIISITQAFKLIK